MYRTAVVLALAGVVLSGCLSPGPAPVEGASVVPRLAVSLAPATACERCYEPTIAALPSGRLVVSTGDTLAVSDDAGRTWERRALPPDPEGALGTFRGDGIVNAAPDGTLYFSALYIQGAGAVAAFGAVFTGFQVASSQDGGDSWSMNSWVSFQNAGPDVRAGGDRQWLAIGDDGRVYLTYNHYTTFAGVFTPVLTVSPPVDEGTGVRVLASEDGGRTFRASVPVLARAPDEGTIGGEPIVVDGALLVPVFHYGNDRSRLLLAVSEDDGATFEHHEVYAPDDAYVGAFFPVVRQGGDGNLHMVWWAFEDGILHAVSTDGGRTWGEPERVDLGGDEPVFNSPWAAPTADGVAVVWSERTGDEASEAHVRVGAEHAVLGPANGFPFREANTDFNHVVALPDGRLAAVLADREDGAVAVAVVDFPRR